MTTNEIKIGKIYKARLECVFKDSAIHDVDFLVEVTAVKNSKSGPICEIRLRAVLPVFETFYLNPSQIEVI